MARALEALQDCEARLRSHYAALADCRVTVEDRPPREFGRRRFNVRLEARVAGHELVVNREHDDDPAEAMAQAFAAAAAQLALLKGTPQKVGRSGELIPEAIRGVRLYCPTVRQSVDVSRTLEECALEHGCTDTSKCPLFSVWRQRARLT